MSVPAAEPATAPACARASPCGVDAGLQPIHRVQLVQLVHLDDALLVVDKPAGLLSVPGRALAHADCVVAQVRARWAPDAREVHRLDMSTSGLMVLARGAEAHRALSRAFADRQVDKTYTALVAGRWAAGAGGHEGWIDLPLRTDWPHRPRQKVDLATGKPSVTAWRQLGEGLAPEDPGLPCTRLALTPVTGRSHQLRVHCLATGHPILGDELYAPGLARVASARLCLHASALGFTHPGSGQRLAFESAAPF
jgi:tRNA pseudouridine32 synthase / 23S rRNA pseudouridine746 synthase